MTTLIARLPPPLAAYLRAVWRRRWLVLAVGWALSLAGWAAVAMMPSRYESMTRLYVETESLLTPLLRNIAVQADLQKQLEVMQRTLLSRANMAEVARAADLDLDVHSQVEMEALYLRLQKAIKVQAEGRNLFMVSYTDGDPSRAKRVVEVLLNIFVETNLGRNRSNMESARSFIETQINEYEAKLKDGEARLAAFKTRNYDMLAAIGQNFSARIDVARQTLAAARVRHEEALLARDRIAAHLAGVPSTLEAGGPQVVIGGDPTSPRQRIQQLEMQLSQMKTRYTERHPDMLAAKRELEDLKAQMAAMPGGGASISAGPRMPNPVHDQIKLRLVQADADVAMAESALKLAEESLRRLNDMAETAPAVEAELASLDRDSGVLKGKYEELLARREAARISEAVENSGDKVQFRVIEPPQLPLVPSFPNRPLFLVAVLVVALGAGVGVALVLHTLDDTIGSAAELEEKFHIRVLAIVPKVESLARQNERRRSLRRFGLAAGGLVAAFVFVMALTLFADKALALVRDTGAAKMVERIVDHAR